MLGSTGTTPKIKVLIVDDSAIVREILSSTIAAEPDMTVVATAPDAYIAAQKIEALKPDVITLDIEMPRMDGLTFLRQIMQRHPIPTIIVSSLGQASCSTALEALRCGAVDVLAKPSGPYSIGDLRLSLPARIRAAAIARPRITSEVSRAHFPSTHPHSLHNPKAVIAIGASTGGLAAIQEILQQLSADMPPIVISQHIPAKFSFAFASRLNKLCILEVREAVDGEPLQGGTALVAPGDYHLLVRRSPAGYRAELQQGPHVCFQRPAVDVMFTSVAQTVGKHAVGVLLTGMGSDGAKGMLALKNAGASTIAQDEETCVVFGMPREAVRLNAVQTVAALNSIPELLVESVRRIPHPSLPIHHVQSQSIDSRKVSA
jgi:two-component system chemotaxis response regulator CheB